MAKKKINSTKIKKIADQLPVILYNTQEYHYVLGAVLIAQGHTEQDGEKINPIKVYTQSMPVQIEINHKRRMKKLFKKHGLAGVNSYIVAVGNLKENIV